MMCYVSTRPNILMRLWWFSKSEHAAIILLPEYKQRIVREALVMREVRRWSDQVDGDIWDVVSDAEWDVPIQLQ